jgi:spermidine/putrescine transport system permease protein
MAVPAETAGAGRLKRRGLRVGPFALGLPAAAGMLLFFAAPLVVFAVYSFLTSTLFAVARPLTAENYRAALDSDLNRQLAENSFVIGLLAATITVAVALPIAYWLRYSAGRWQLPVLFLITASMFASYLVRIYAWRTILGSNGALNNGLERLGLIDEPLGFLLYNKAAVTIALVHIYLPYVVLVLFAGFGPIAGGLLEAAQDLGASAARRWRSVILPLMAAPAATAFLFVFVLSASDYVTPQFLGGTDGAMLGVQIQANFTGVGNWPLGAAISFLMLGAFVLCYALVALGLRLLRLDRVRFSS